MFDYACVDSCESVFGQLSQTWSIFRLENVTCNENMTQCNEDLAEGSGNLLASEGTIHCMYFKHSNIILHENN